MTNQKRRKKGRLERMAQRWLDKIMDPDCMDDSIASLTRLLKKVDREAEKRGRMKTIMEARS